jgi:CBS-domain-containing membrane protein
VARFLPEIRDMLGGGLITVEEVEIYQYSSRFKETLPDLPVRAVMTAAVLTVHLDTPLEEAARVLLQHVFTALPVVDVQQHLLGILYEVDLLPMVANDVAFLDSATQGLLHEPPGSLEGTVETVMRREVLHVDPSVSIRTAAHLMLSHEVQQLPVVDDAGRLVGIISRIDLLRTVSAGYFPQEGPQPTAVPTGGPLTTVHEVMSVTLPTVALEASLTEVTTVMLGAETQCVLVLDAVGCLAGMITPSDLVQRLDPAARPGVMQRLRSHLPLAGQAAAQQAVRRGTARQAQEIMTAPVVSVTPDTPLSTALLLVTQRGWKRLPVCDAQRHPLGLLSRKELLRAVLR